MRYVLIFCLLLGACSLPHDINTGKPILWSEVPNYFFGPFFREDPGWDFWDDPLRQNVKCPKGETCVDLTPSVKLLNEEGIPKLKGWKSTICVHSKQVDPQTEQDLLYCEHCNKEGQQMWMIYDYETKKWKSDSHYLACGTPLKLFKN